MPKIHRTELPYDPMPRQIPLDRDLDFADVGIYAWARALPDGAEISVEEIVRQHRGVGMPRAREGVKKLRDRGLWHTITLRTTNPDKPLQSFVVVSPDPWPRQRAVDALLADPKIQGQPVDGPHEARLRGVPSADIPSPADVSAGQPDRQSADDQAADRQHADRQPPADHSYNREKKNYPPNPPASQGGHGCPKHHRPTRGCCTDRDKRAAETAARVAAQRERDAVKRATPWCGRCDGPETRRVLETGPGWPTPAQPCPNCNPEAMTA